MNRTEQTIGNPGAEGRPADATTRRYRSPWRRVGFAMAASCGIVLASSATEANDTKSAGDLRAALEDWQTVLGRISTIASDFLQEKRMALFQYPLTIRGKMFIATNGNFAWETHWPVRYKMVVADGRIRQWDEETDRVQTISMRDNPAAAAIHEQMSAWFSGQYAALTNTYAVTLASAQPVSFRFTPRSGSPATNYLTSVQVWLRDDGRYLERLRILERSGDGTDISFTNTVVNQPIPADAWNVRHLAATNAAPTAGGDTRNR